MMKSYLKAKKNLLDWIFKCKTKKSITRVKLFFKNILQAKI